MVTAAKITILLTARVTKARTAKVTKAMTRTPSRPVHSAVTILVMQIGPKQLVSPGIASTAFVAAAAAAPSPAAAPASAAAAASAAAGPPFIYFTFSCSGNPDSDSGRMYMMNRPSLSVFTAPVCLGAGRAWVMAMHTPKKTRRVRCRMVGAVTWRRKESWLLFLS